MFFKKIHKFFSHEELVKIFKYIHKPALVTLLIAVLVVFVATLALIIFGKLENIIVSMNIRYNSPFFGFLTGCFALVQAGALIYGINKSLRKYTRPGGKNLINTYYPNGNSYKALNHALVDKIE